MCDCIEQVVVVLVVDVNDHFEWVFIYGVFDWFGVEVG